MSIIATLILPVKWNIVYHELALAIAAIRAQHGRSTSAEIYSILVKDSKFLNNNPWFSKYSSMKDQLIDPMVLFASINAAMSKRENRQLRVNHLCRIFLGKEFGAIDFTGCPTPISINLMSIRNKSSQETIWWMFENALKFGPVFLEDAVFKRLEYLRGIDIVSFTIFLFWIDSDRFLPLDKNTVGFLLQTGRIKSIPKGYIEYANLLESHDMPFVETAKIAYEIQQSKTIQLDAVEGLEGQQNKAQGTIGNFRLIGVRPLPDLGKDLKKVLDLDTAYSFYNAFDLEDFNNVTYDPQLDIPVYSLPNLPVNISAIVGKNGMGKSTITELLYIAINILAEDHPAIKTELEPVEEFSFELYYIGDFLYCIRFNNSKPVVYRYSSQGNLFTDPTEVPLEDFDLGQFFFTIAINYSLYGLNSRHVGRWINPIFEKNDGYQVPLTINPYRKSGNIDVNTEEGLTKQRLLVNLLMPAPASLDEMNLRKLTDKASAEFLVLKLNRSKFSSLYAYDVKGRQEKEIISFSVSSAYYKVVLTKVCEKFGLDVSLIPSDIKQRNTLIDFAFWYILKKLVNIAMTYPGWDYFDIKGKKFKRYRTFVNRLFEDYSHITNKLRQAINFIKHEHVSKFVGNLTSSDSVDIPIDALSNEISSILSQSGENGLDTIHLIPPTFFSASVRLDDGSDLERLSSGEKQRIYAVNSLVYHLYNLNSVSVQKDLINYRYVNIIFDEIELYFHPEMQQDFISYLLAYISRVQLDRIAALNILIITHSPFILSDIPNSNILFLGKVSEDIKTFGSNIHDLLANSFFMSGFMGNHVKKLIVELVQYLSGDEGDDTTRWSKESSAKIIHHIGEPLIKQRLWELHQTKFKEEIDKEQLIAELELKLKELKGETNTQ